jgi:hypothetical protein
MNTTCKTRLYSIEAWKGLDCITFSTGRQARTIRRLAEHYTTDLGADRLYVRREATPGGASGSNTVATYTNNGWQSITDERLAGYLEGDMA